MADVDTSSFFVGGNGMFIEYHDIIKPAYLYAIVQLMLGDSHGVPTEIIENFSLLSLLEWYKNRRYYNPIQQLDINHQTDPTLVNELMQSLLNNDASIYSLAPALNIDRMFAVYRSQHFTFPIYVYTPNNEPNAKPDIDKILNGITHEYLHGDLVTAIKKCDQNFTYIFSNIETMNSAVKLLHGTYSHVLLARDYRYNYIDYYHTFRYDLSELMRKHPFVRIGTTTAMDIDLLTNSFDNIVDADIGGDKTTQSHNILTEED